MEAEFPVFRGSKLVGLTIKELEDKYKVTVIHLHPQHLLIETRIGPHPDLKIYEAMYIKIEGKIKQIEKCQKEAYTIKEDV